MTPMAVGYVEVPEGWTRLGGRGLGPFVTREVFARPDGTRAVWESRWHRKHPGRATAGSAWWAPGAVAWWIGVLFAIGSVCFALGSFPPFATTVGANPDNLTYFIGSLFFTTRRLPAVRRDRVGGHLPRRVPAARGFRALFRVQHHRIDWWAALIQFAGTLWFNRTTLSALVVGLGASPGHHPVWRPDALGSICFLVSSWLAWAEECHGRFAWRPSQIPWWITLLNLVGSVAFGVSAIASYVTPSGQLLSLALTNLGTFVGALCFLAGAVLLLPERTMESPSPDAGPEQPGRLPRGRRAGGGGSAGGRAAR